MRLALAVFFASPLIALVVGSPLVDTSPNMKQLILSSQDTIDLPGQCQPEGSLCDWPAGSRGPCCPPLLCVPLTTENLPYLVCA